MRRAWHAGPIGLAVAAVVAIVEAVLDAFGISIFGGGGSRPTPPPMDYRFFHYPSADFLGVSQALVPTENKCNCPTPPEAPPGVSLDQNIRIAQSHQGFPWIWFYNQEKDRGPWDYKYTHPVGKYDKFGNFNYGATGAACGFSEATLDAAAVAVKLRHGRLEE